MHACFLSLCKHHAAIRIFHVVLYIFEKRRITDRSVDVAGNPSLRDWCIAYTIIATRYTRVIGTSPYVCEVETMTDFMSEYARTSGCTCSDTSDIIMHRDYSISTWRSKAGIISISSRTRAAKVMNRPYIQ